MGRWQRYWFADGGRYGLAIVRIAVAVSVLMSLARLATHPQLVAPAGIYRPVGIWMLFGSSPPPAVIVDVLWVLAWAGTVAMLLGLASRVSTVVSFAAAVTLAALSFSGSASWSHQYNVVFLAQLALLGGRTGDALGVDALIRRLRGRQPLDVAGAYQWTLRLVQLAVALMFVGAVFHKLLHGHFTLRWAFSDNLRHHLLVRFDLAGLPRPELVQWIIDDVWRYRTAAVLNLVSQLAPLFAVIFVRRPLVRAIAGMFFVTEVIALGLVVNLWNLHWLPLVAVFIDWDRAIARVAQAFGRTPTPSAVVVAPHMPRARQAFIGGFVVLDILTAFIPTLDRRLNSYPFSSFPMFATIRAARPYDQHLPYTVIGDHFTVTTAKPLEPYAQAWFDHTNRNLHLQRDPGKLRARLASILAISQQRYPWFGITGVRHHVTLFEAPAYPAPARFAMQPIAITGELTPDGNLRTVLGRWDGTTVELRPQHVDTTGARLVAYSGERATPQELAATRTGETFTLAAPITARPAYIVAIIGDTPWLVTSKR
ncbi:MAG: hypothetical protein H0T89_19045 [Deltaproteobacteria bacterium]|nr:hypothetical protein [Deltaproteobacteria bacterium]MDQ3296367.1 hypothetical protein [Myxococcota bacterium]